MNKIFLVAICFGLSSIASAQSNKRLSAQNYLKAYYDYKELDKLPKAKEAIDAATIHEETKGDAKTWIWRGKIYQAIFEQNLKDETDKQTAVQDAARKTLAAYQAVKADELQQAMEAYMKTKELDAKKYFFEEMRQKSGECLTHYVNKGIANYNSKQYAEALPFYMKAIDLGNFLGVVDTTVYTSAAYVAEKSGNTDAAKTLYQKLIDMKYGRGNTFITLSNVYMNAKDSAGAFDVVKKGRLAYPDDLNLLITETNFYLKANKTAEAENNLKIAVEKSPKDANLQLVLGNIYDNMANPKDDKYKDLPKPKDYEDLIAKAESHYKKATDLKVVYFDALYNLGVLYNNHGVAISKNSDTITDQAKYAKENARANDEYKKALPYLEKCLALNPKDKGTMYALKQLYARTQQTEKLQKINEMLKN